jgi:hypothetical protein
MTITPTAAARPVRLAYVPGFVKFDRALREQRTARYRTWHSRHPDMAYCAECLLCGEWGSGFTSREQAAASITGSHASFCHVINGCHCPEPHLTAAIAARVGVVDSYPYDMSGWLFALAGGTRRYLPPRLDRNGTPFGGPEFGSGGYNWIWPDHERGEATA